MIIGTYDIKDLGQGHIGVVRDCHLCGDEFVIGIHDPDTICPRCKELWKVFIESKERTEE